VVRYHKFLGLDESDNFKDSGIGLIAIQTWNKLKLPEPTESIFNLTMLFRRKSRAKDHLPL